jgi:dihydroorotate dehydrogenase
MGVHCNVNGYTTFLQPILFSLDAEQAHDLTFSLLSAFPALAVLQRSQASAVLATTCFGLRFPNPVGLAAGLDKNARLLKVWQTLGFGFVEIGTITPRPQTGNPKPRLFRLPKDQALINRMGFNNEGMEVVARRLEHKPKGLVVGINIGKNKDTPNDQAEQDYITCFRRLRAFADYFVVNVSSPNTPGLRALQDKEPLLRLLSQLQNENNQSAPLPLLLKVSPDLTESQLAEIAEVVQQTQLAGVVATNTTIGRVGLVSASERVEKIGAGGLSGAPLRTQALQVLTYLHQAGIRVIAVGGISSGADAVGRMKAGASLVQVYSGLIYKGPKLLQEMFDALGTKA